MLAWNRDCLPKSFPFIVHIRIIHIQLESPHAAESIRIILCVNQRQALHAPRAHQSLVGGAFLEYDEQLRKLPLPEQVKAYRNRTAAQANEEIIEKSQGFFDTLTQLVKELWSAA